jgi:ATP/maltotriose-dependent transcriptional regulator MalT
MHELIRQYCGARLKQEHFSETGEDGDLVKARHVAYFRSFVLRQEQVFFRQCTEALQEARPEYTNLAAAWDGFVDPRDPSAFREITGAFLWLTDRLAWWSSALPLFEASLCRLREAYHDERHDPLTQRCLGLALTWMAIMICEVQMRIGRASDAAASLHGVQDILSNRMTDDVDWVHTHLMLVRAGAWVNHILGNYGAAEQGFRAMLDDLQMARIPAQAFPLHNSLGWEAEACWGLSFSVLSLGCHDDAYQWAKASIQIAQEFGSEFSEAMAERPLVLCLIAKGRYPEAEKVAQKLLRAAKHLGDKYMTAQGLSLLAQVYIERGEPELAQVWARRCIRLCRQIDLVEQTLPTGLCTLATAEFSLGRAASAVRLCQENLALLERSDNVRVLAYMSTAIVMGQIALADGQPETAAGWVLRAFTAPTRSAGATAKGLLLMAEILRAQDQSEHAAAILAFVAYSSLSWHATQQKAATALHELQDTLPPETFASAVARGEASSLDNLIAEGLRLLGNQG